MIHNKNNSIYSMYLKGEIITLSSKDHRVKHFFGRVKFILWLSISFTLNYDIYFKL